MMSHDVLHCLKVYIPPIRPVGLFDDPGHVFVPGAQPNKTL